MFRLPVCCLVAFIAVCPAVGDEIGPIRIWLGDAPDETYDVGPEEYLEQTPGKRIVKRLTNVTNSSLTVYRPHTANGKSPAVLVRRSLFNLAGSVRRMDAEPRIIEFRN